MTTTRVTRHVNAPRAAVYQALIDPDALAAWRVPVGMTCVVHEHDAREGGRIRVSLSYDQPAEDGEASPRVHTYHGYFATLVPDEKVVEVLEFETDDPARRGEMRMTTTLVDSGGGTDVVLTHENLPPGVSPADNETGTVMALDKLAALLRPA